MITLAITLLAADPIPRAGLFERGINLEIPALGPMFVATPVGTKTGVSGALALQLDLGPRLAMRFPFDVGTSFGGTTAGFATFGFVPGLLYRFRASADDAVVPYLGAGVRFMAVGVGRGHLGVPLVAGVAATKLSTGTSTRPTTAAPTIPTSRPSAGCRPSCGREWSGTPTAGSRSTSR